MRRSPHRVSSALFAAACLLAAVTARAATDLAIGDASVTEGDAGTVTLDFTVTRSGDLTNAVSIGIETDDGPTDPATAGSDFAAIPSGTTAVLPAGQASSTVSVIVAGDAAPEADETLLLRILSGYEIVLPAYGAPVSFAAGDEPLSVAIGDLDGDGKPDLAVANRVSDSISVYRNTSASGVISFAARQDFTTAKFPFSVAIGDLDGDGKPDLAVATTWFQTISVLRSTATSGSISFAPFQDFPASNTPVHVAIGDLDGDGKADVAAANLGVAAVSVFRNTSSGSAIDFAGKQDFVTSSSLRSVAIGDIDGDQKPDLITANQAASSISVLRNEVSVGIDATSFPAIQDFPVGTQPYFIAVGDLDGDGPLDVAVVNASSNSVSILRNTASSGVINLASLAPKEDFATNTAPVAVAISDLDGDLRPDLVTANAAGGVSVLRNTSTTGVIDGTAFDPKKDFAAGTNPSSVAIGDMNGDGKLDLWVANQTSDNVSVLESQASLAALSDDEAVGTVLDDDDLAPAPFSFTPVTGIDLSTMQFSNTVTIAGINGAAPISVANGEYSIGCTGTFRSTASTITDGQTVCVRHNSAGTFSTATITTLTVGTVDGSFTSTTLAQDLTPAPFSFAPVTGVNLSTTQVSNTVTIAGINNAAPISVANGEYSIGCTGTFRSTPGTITNGQTVCVRHDAAGAFLTSTTTTLTVGGVAADFVSRTLAGGGAPPDFTDPPPSEVEPGAIVVSDAITITGLAGPTPISIVDGEYSIGCTGVFTSAPGTISNGDTVCVRHVSSSKVGTITTTVLTIGGMSITFTSTTPAGSSRGGAFGLLDALLGLLAGLRSVRRRRLLGVLLAAACLAAPAGAWADGLYVAPQLNYALSTNGGEAEAGLGGSVTLGGAWGKTFGWEASMFYDHYNAGGAQHHGAGRGTLETNDLGVALELLTLLGSSRFAPWLGAGAGAVMSDNLHQDRETNPMVKVGMGFMSAPAKRRKLSFRTDLHVRWIFLDDSTVFQQEDVQEVILRVGLLVPI